MGLRRRALVRRFAGPFPNPTCAFRYRIGLSVAFAKSGDLHPSESVGPYSLPRGLEHRRRRHPGHRMHPPDAYANRIVEQVEHH